MTRMDFGAQQKLIQLELILVGKEIGERVGQNALKLHFKKNIWGEF